MYLSVYLYEQFPFLHDTAPLKGSRPFKSAWGEHLPEAGTFVGRCCTFCQCAPVWVLHFFESELLFRGQHLLRLITFCPLAPSPPCRPQGARTKPSETHPHSLPSQCPRAQRGGERVGWGRRCRGSRGRARGVKRCAENEDGLFRLE